MKLSKYRLTINNMTGSAVIVYQDGEFKSFLTEVKPPFTDIQLKWLLGHIPAQEFMLAESLVLKSKGKIAVEVLNNDSKIELLNEEKAGTNKYLALFCDMYKENLKVAYKVSPADAGKLKSLPIEPHEWLNLLTTYFDSDNFLFKNKYSISNLVKYINELRVEAFGQKKEAKKKFPLPYDHLFCVKLNPSELNEYWAFLRENGYIYDVNASRGGKWVKVGETA